MSTERPMTAEAAQALLAAATPGPWTHEHVGYGGHEVTMDARHGVFVDGPADAALIAAAPDLAATAVALHKRLDAMADAVQRERAARHHYDDVCDDDGASVDDMNAASKALREAIDATNALLREAPHA